MKLSLMGTKRLKIVVPVVPVVSIEESLLLSESLLELDLEEDFDLPGRRECVGGFIGRTGFFPGWFEELDDLLETESEDSASDDTDTVDDVSSGSASEMIDEEELDALESDSSPLFVERLEDLAGDDLLANESAWCFPERPSFDLPGNDWICFPGVFEEAAAFDHVLRF
jgi:hypothetical protein